MILLVCPKYCYNVFQQFINVIQKELEHLNYSCHVRYVEELNQSDHCQLLILLGSQHISDLYSIKKHTNHLILWNFEQLIYEKWDKVLIKNWILHESLIDEIWDYSQININYIQTKYPKFSIPIQKIQLGYSKFFIIPSTQLSNDNRIAFIGNMSNRRYTLLSNVKLPYKVYNQHYFDSYNQIVLQHHFFLNIHYQTPSILEVFRILPLVCNKKIVFTERSIDEELDEMFKDLVYYFDKDDISRLESSLDWSIQECKYQQFQKLYPLQDTLSEIMLNHPEWVQNSSICIATLHCNNRQTIFELMDTFSKQTNISSSMDTHWVILSQGCTDEHNEEIESIFTTCFGESVKLHLIPFLVNMGWSDGMNEMYEYIKNQNFQYVLHLEDDWICDSSSIGMNWLEDCLIYMDHHIEISTLFLRQYRSMEEKHHYGWTRTFRYRCFQQPDEPFDYQTKIKTTPKQYFRNLELREIPKFMYTANPTLFRLQDYIDCSIFPFPSCRDASQNSIYWSTTTTDDAPEWGHSEALSMEKLLSKKCMNVNKGIFYHHF